jgi:CDP-glycerol glycerophosphotransferase (TagB/SpsB family)
MMRAQFGAGPVIELSGTGPRPQAVELVGPRARATAKLTGRGTTWRAVIALRASRWGGPALPLPAGRYEVRITASDGGPLPVDAELGLAQLGVLRAELRGGEVVIGPPVDPAYDSGEGQDALERRYATRPQGLENAVFFESFYGRNAGCNPLAIDRELARLAPSVVRYWSVVDLSVEVPDGAVAVVEGSPEWWRARGAARLLVVNDWLRRRFSRRPGQVVLQTWHGTPLKRLALQREGFHPRRWLAVLREARRWNVLLAQNPYSERIFRKAYAFRGPIWVEGYPRNDVLVRGEDAGVRAALGIGEQERVVLYAPTWRDDREHIVDFLDLDRLAAAAGAVVLVRGHSRTLMPGVDVGVPAADAGDGAAPRVLDVTAYPDISRLLVAADALVTDYSSVMFDFTATGKPIFFFAPDLEHYRGELRGFSLDLAAHAPGPVTATQDELEEALADDEVRARYADRYAAWRERFNARDDGHAAERVVARILDQGYVDRAS